MCEPYVGRGRGDNERGVPSLVLERGSKMVVKSLRGTWRDRTEGVVLVPDIMRSRGMRSLGVDCVRNSVCLISISSEVLKFRIARYEINRMFCLNNT